MVQCSGFRVPATAGSWGLGIFVEPMNWGIGKLRLEG